MRTAPAFARFACAALLSLLLGLRLLGATGYMPGFEHGAVTIIVCPDADPDLLQTDTFELVCQVNGKVRDRISAPTGAARDELERLCLEARGVQSHVDGLDIAKVIVVPDKLVNVVVR